MAMPNYRNWRPEQTEPIDAIAAIAPNDSTDLPDGVTRAIYVGVTGDVAVHDRYDNAITLKNMAQGVWHPMKVKRVLATGTGATDLVAGY